MNTYEVNLKSEINRKKELITPVFPQNLERKTSLDLQKVMEGTCSPQHLLIESLNSCLMAAFFVTAENSNIPIISFESSSSFTIEVIKGKETITEIILRPKIVIPYFQNPERVRYLLEKTKKACLIPNTLGANIRVDPEVSIELILISKE
jgi:organic hydroperoxide reductase OsmC/OhrA